MDKGLNWFDMNSSPHVTVLMPVYNCEKYLPDAIESILNQSYTDYEFLIVDDGSRDRSVEIIKSYEDYRIRLFQNSTNLQLITTLNKGIRLSRGEYIARMDADDISCPQRLKAQVDFLDSNPTIDLVGSNFYIIDATKDIIQGPILKGFLSAGQVDWELYWGNPIVHPTTMFRKDVVLSYGGYPEDSHNCEDYALWLKLAQTSKISVLSEPLLYLRKHEDNLTQKNLERHTQAVVRLAQESLFSMIGYRPSFRSLYLIRYLPTGFQISSSEMKEARKLILKAYRCFMRKHASEKNLMEKWIERDVSRRLIDLVGNYGNQHLLQSLITFFMACYTSPSTSISFKSIKVFLRMFIKKNYLTTQQLL